MEGFIYSFKINETFPIYLLLNCIWNKRKTDLNDVIKFLYLLSLEGNITIFQIKFVSC